MLVAGVFYVTGRWLRKGSASSCTFEPPLDAPLWKEQLLVFSTPKVSVERK